MKGLQISYHIFLPIFLLLFFVFVVQVRGEKEEEKNVYVVYMGATTSTGSSLRDDHVQLLASVLEREVGHAEKSILHSYKHGFSGFTARLSAEEARAMAKKTRRCISFCDPILQLHTTRSWDFLQYQTDLEKDSNNGSDVDSASGGTDTIIGLLDTGVWPESESFSDGGMGEIPARWKGVCKGGYDFNASSCNRCG